jgi:hypothetical protein
MHTITLVPEFADVADSLGVLLKAAPNLPLKLRELALDSCERPLEFRSLNLEDVATASASELRVTLKPNDGLRRLLSALRTRDVESDVPIQHR